MLVLILILNNITTSPWIIMDTAQVPGTLSLPGKIPKNLGGEGLLWPARGQVTPSPPAPPWPLGSPDARLIRLVGQLRLQPALSVSCRDTAASSYQLEVAEPVAGWVMSRQGGPQADMVQRGSSWLSPCLQPGDDVTCPHVKCGIPRLICLLAQSPLVPI